MTTISAYFTPTCSLLDGISCDAGCVALNFMLLSVILIKFYNDETCVDKVVNWSICNTPAILFVALLEFKYHSRFPYAMWFNNVYNSS